MGTLGRSLLGALPHVLALGRHLLRSDLVLEALRRVLEPIRQRLRSGRLLLLGNSLLARGLSPQPVAVESLVRVAKQRGSTPVLRRSVLLVEY